ncbi:RidA family protein [Streptomyces tubbatahanensis]|uniref:RidA family protein n=1 Tax=Streptomyces tubbatahanensis TaxID=2923272 RepID=A0ABY3XYW5_9ACTN|nr:RidA family protein [Streptomyces tubbatahanensis]UNS99749.1 RidA family protein [Streptomyces tubbatahanensis]
MSTLNHIAIPAGLAPGNGYSHVVQGEGRIVAISGQVSLGADGNVVGEGDPMAQAEQVFANLQRCLDEAGATFAQVAKFTFFVTDLAVMPALRAVRDRYLDPQRLPACSAVQVAGLVRPELLIEIEALAVLPSGAARP